LTISFVALGLKMEEEGLAEVLVFPCCREARNTFLLHEDRQAMLSKAINDSVG
jgi:hypothetical protein